ncbi:MAG: PBP1A family penicillin-binding protein [Bdellovibrio sp.]
MKKILTNIAIFSAGGAFLGAVLVVFLFIYYSFQLPKIKTLADYRPPVQSKVLTRDGVIIAEFGNEKRQIVSFEEIPKIIVDAFLSAEDDNFYDHDGVDYAGVLRAMVKNVIAGRVVQGGSTITQQVAKSLLLEKERTFSRKIKDFLLAQKLEEKLSKQEILFLYLNQVYLGGGYYGVKSAFRGYFDKDLNEVTVAESAMLAGLLVAPGRYSPYLSVEMSKKRQEYVLRRMFETGKITEDQYKTALNQELKFRVRRKTILEAPYFIEFLKQQLASKLNEEELANGGYTIKTTIDYELQRVAEKSLAQGVRDIDKRQGFSGPIKKIENKDIEDWSWEQRLNLYKENSNFFTISKDLIRKDEFEADQEEKNKLQEHRNQFKKERGILAKLVPGNLDDDKVSSILSINDIYHGVVLKTYDPARVVFADIAGVTCVIPQSGFEWAHERKISEEFQYFAPVTKPSQILNPGDVVNLKVTGKNVAFNRLVYKTFLPTLEKLKGDELKELGKQRYHTCELEQDPIVEASALTMNPFNGEVLAYVGGADFKKSQFNRVYQSKRQPGSSFKSILYAAALENGYTPATIINDSPEALGGVDQGLNWKPSNYDRKFLGPVTFRKSLEQSRNVPTVKIAQKLGVKTIHDFAKRIGFEAELENDLSLSLGSFGVSLETLVKTYAIFPNGGKKINPVFIKEIIDRDGNVVSVAANTKKEESVETSESSVIEQTPTISTGQDLPSNPFLSSLNEERIYDERLAYIMTNLLRGVVLNGTGQSAKELSFFLGGKTGTTNNYIDAWFVGFSSNLITGVWTGFDDNQTMGWGETGAKSALPIWKEIMRLGLSKYGENDFKSPKGIINLQINKDTGELAKAGDTNVITEAFAEGTEPGRSQASFEEKDSTPSTEIIEDDDYYNRQ